MTADDGNSKASRKNSWVRLWKDLPTDPKFRVIAKRSGRPLSEVVAVFVLMMTAADDDGALDWHADDAAAALDLEPEHVEAIHAAMQGKVLDANNLTGWRKRQPKREDCSTERVREFRKRRETQCNADETQGNAPEKRREDKIREEKKDTTDRPEQVAARETDGRTPICVELKSAFNGTTDAMLAFIEAAMGPGSRANAENWLAATTSAHGSAAVAQAFATIAEKRAAGEVIVRPLPLWSNIAAGIKSGHASPKRPAWATEQEARKKAAREAVFGTGGTA